MGELSREYNKLLRKKKELTARQFRKLYQNKPNIPGYKEKNGETVAYFTNQQAKIKDGYLTFLGCIKSPRSPRWLPPIKTRFKGKFSHIEIVPIGAAYIVGIIYEKEIVNRKFPLERVSS